MIERIFKVPKETKRMADEVIQKRYSRTSEFYRRAILDFVRYVAPRTVSPKDKETIERAQDILDREAARKGRELSLNLVELHASLASEPDLTEEEIKAHVEKIRAEQEIEDVKVRLPENVMSVLSQYAKQYGVDESHMFALMLMKKVEEEGKIDEIMKRLQNK
ncbi:MAG: hypothetical protein J7K68_05135 [Candidatus Diapherotrites archaeon]|nr:hypothetical protein [Candidatus Diapherotrites archaeon]